MTKIPPHPDEVNYVRPWEYQYKRAEWWRDRAVEAIQLAQDMLILHGGHRYGDTYDALRKAIEEAT